MRLVSYFILALLLISSIACESGMDGGEMDEEMEASVAKEEMLNAETTQASPVLPERKIIREANIRFQVDDLSESSNRVEALVEKYNATITNSRSYNASERIEASYTIKVVPDKLFELMRDIQGESIFLDNKSITAEDVTRQYMDIEARIKAKQVARQRYLELLQQANKVEDILAIEVEIRKVQEELESVQAQLKALQQQTSYSTIHLTMYQLVPASYTDRTNFSTRLVSALEGGWYLFKNLLVGMVYLWPLLIVAVLVLLVMRWLKKKRRGIV